MRLIEMRSNPYDSKQGEINVFYKIIKVFHRNVELMQ